MIPKQSPQFLHQIVQNRLVQHSLFWALSLYVLFKIFNLNDTLAWTDWIYTVLFHLSLAILVYLNTMVLIPYLLRRNWYILFILGSVILTVGAAILNQFTFTTFCSSMIVY